MDEPGRWFRTYRGRLLGVIGAAVLVILLLTHPLLWLLLGGLLFFVTILALPLLILFWPEIIRRQQVIDRWDTLIAGGQGQSERVVGATTALVDGLELPQIALEQAKLAPGIVKGLVGTKRPFLVVSQTDNFNLQPYRMYVNVRDYGASLQTSWYLVFQPGLLQRLRMLVLRRGNHLMLDLFDEQDLRAYVTAVHHCFLQAVVELLTTLGQDSSQLNRSSKGFLGIS